MLIKRKLFSSTPNNKESKAEKRRKKMLIEQMEVF